MDPLLEAARMLERAATALRAISARGVYTQDEIQHVRTAVSEALGLLPEDKS